MRPPANRPAVGLMRRDVGSRYMVIASLPHLPRFDRARRLPIGRETLAARLVLLPSIERDEVDAAHAFLSWQRFAALVSDADVVLEYRRVLTLARTDDLRRLVTFRLGMRTLIAALRRRRMGEGRPQRHDLWGVGPWVHHIVTHYEDADFGLRHVVPWFARARQMFDDGDFAGLEHLVFEVSWNDLDKMAASDRFGFRAVLAYVFKWDLVDRWLGHDAATAALRIDQLAQEALGGFAQPFNAA